MTLKDACDWGLFSAGVDATTYGSQEKYQAALLDQYKLYVEMTDRVSTRRLTANSYFLSVNTALLAFVGYLTTKESNAHTALIGSAGIVLSVLWFQIVTSYRDLNTNKFKVLHEVERRLPLALYEAEWVAMKSGQDPDVYRPMSHIERVVPWVFLALHGYVFLTGLTHLDWVRHLFARAA